MILQILIIFLLTWLLRMHINQTRRKVNLPGPKGIPIFGNFFSLDKKFHLQGYKFSEKYGKALVLRIINTNVVSISDVRLAKELFSLEQLTGRPTFDFLLMYEGEPLGVINSEGKLWEAHRRFTLRQLRDFGFGKSTMESMILDEVRELVDTLKRTNGAPVGGIKELLSLAVVNSLWTVVSGKRYNQDDPNLQALTRALNRALNAPAESGGVVFFMPVLRFIMPEYTGYRATRDAFEQLKSFVLESVKEHQRTFEPDICRDFIDVYLKEMQSEKDPNCTFYGKAAEKQLVAVVGDLFFAGSDTTSTTLAWAILYLASNPEVQQKLNEEIKLITGESRKIALSDRPSSSYLLAVIDESLRMSSILPNGVGHEATTDFTHKGVKYPKGTLVGMNVYYIHKNPETWGDPENFRPERFLTGEGNTYKKNENVVSFSVGRRQCLGETMARDSLFLFIGGLVQNFEMLLEPDKPKPSLEPAVGFLLNPQEYSVIFKSRN